MQSAVISGVGARLVQVEVHRGPGLPRQTIVGLAGSAVRESLERIHAACSHSGLGLKPRRTTINLAPADCRKRGSGLDLPIALGLLAAEGTIEAQALEDALCVGELALDGTVRGVPGVLPAVIAAQACGLGRVLVPGANGAEAAAVEGIDALTVESLERTVAYLRGEAELTPAAAGSVAATANGTPDLADVRGHLLARRAIEVAAAGGHHLLMSGPPGAGKTLLARTLPGLLPPLEFDEAIEVSSVHSVVGGLDGGLLRRRPFRAPHHTVTTAGLVGGGSPIRPGEISLATRGVLFLDELPEFSRGVLESLRQPLEEGVVAIARANEAHRFPTRFQLIAAMNECPCGRGPADEECACTSLEIARYWKRVSGPLLDRIDLSVIIERLPLRELTEPGPDAESSAAVAARVVAARRHQAARNAGYIESAANPGGRLLNVDLPPRALRAACELTPKLLEHGRVAAERLSLSARAWYRMLRVARTCADLDGSRIVGEGHLLEALQYRRPA